MKPAFAGFVFVFLDLNYEEIGVQAVIDALKALNINEKYIENLAPIANNFTFPDEWPKDDAQFELFTCTTKGDANAC